MKHVKKHFCGYDGACVNKRICNVLLDLLDRMLIGIFGRHGRFRMRLRSKTELWRLNSEK